MNSMITLIMLAFQFPATVYGVQGAGPNGGYEKNCGDPEKPRPCDNQAITASGERFDPADISAAVPAPRNKRIRITHIWVRAYNNVCIKLKINDKKNWRYIGNGGLDLTPAAVMAITGKLPNRFWSGKLEAC